LAVNGGRSKTTDELRVEGGLQRHEDEPEVVVDRVWTSASSPVEVSVPAPCPVDVSISLKLSAIGSRSTVRLPVPVPVPVPVSLPLLHGSIATDQHHIHLTSYINLSRSSSKTLFPRY